MGFLVFHKKLICCSSTLIGSTNRGETNGIPCVAPVGGKFDILLVGLGHRLGEGCQASEKLRTSSSIYHTFTLC